MFVILFECVCFDKYGGRMHGSWISAHFHIVFSIDDLGKLKIDDPSRVSILRNQNILSNAAMDDAKGMNGRKSF